jgi:hypothetical protein
LSNVTSFLLARIDEDAAEALAAIEPDQMYPYGDRRFPPLSVEEWPAEVQGYLGGTWGIHCARWNPSRVLAECTSKRSIVEAFGYLENDPSRLTDVVRHAIYHLIRSTVILPMAEVYSGHPDYDSVFRA